MITAEQRALAQKEEAALAARHAKRQAVDLNQTSNQKKNAKLYKELSDELKAKTNGKRSKVRVFRQCSVGGDPDDYALQTLKGMTYFRVQYFLNVDGNGKAINGKAKHILKITWSDHENPALAQQSRFQSTVFMNLYEGKLIYERARDHLDTPEEAAKVKAQFKQYNKENPAVPGHIIQKNLFGFTAVQVEKGGTQIMNYNQAEVFPVLNDEGKFEAILKLRVKEETLIFVLHDVTNRLNADGSARGDKAAKMVGFLARKSDAEEKEDLFLAITKLNNKSENHADIGEVTTQGVGVASIEAIGEASEMCVQHTPIATQPIGCQSQTTQPEMQYRRVKGFYRSLIKARSSSVMDSQWRKRLPYPVGREINYQRSNIHI